MTEPAHSAIGPSAASRWLACPGSVPFAVSLSQGEGDGGSEYAKEGTAAHALLEMCLLEDNDAYVYAGQMIGEYEVTAEMADCVQEAVDYDSKWDNDHGPSTYGGVEERLYLREYDERLFGTCDRYAIAENRVLVLDYKHGAGDEVEVENNPQALVYALGVLALHPVADDTPVDLVILQPRAGGVKRWTVTARYIWDWAEKVLVPGLARVREAEGRFNPLVGPQESLFEADLKAGSHCVWCPAKLHCPVAKEYLGVPLAVTGKENLDDLQIGELVDIFVRARLVRRFLKEVEERLVSLTRKGQKVPGVKLVAGRGTRVWSDPKKAQAMLTSKLGEKAFNKSLLSPAQAEKMVGKPEVAKLAFLREGGVQLALDGDRRSGLNVATAKQVFAHLLEGDNRGE
jgi:hypothetical protein